MIILRNVSLYLIGSQLWQLFVARLFVNCLYFESNKVFVEGHNFEEGQRRKWLTDENGLFGCKIIACCSDFLMFATKLRPRVAMLLFCFRFYGIKKSCQINFSFMFQKCTWNKPLLNQKFLTTVFSIRLNFLLTFNFYNLAISKKEWQKQINYDSHCATEKRDLNSAELRPSSFQTVELFFLWS